MEYKVSRISPGSFRLVVKCEDAAQVMVLNDAIAGGKTDSSNAAAPTLTWDQMSGADVRRVSSHLMYMMVEWDDVSWKTARRRLLPA